jgi:putative ABC transport system ATP-binding protein
MMWKYACEFTHVSKRFDGQTVISDLSFQIKRGEMVALTGPSGCGKSTVLNMIGLLVAPSTGTIKLFDEPAPSISSRRAQQLLRTRLGYLFQNFALIDSDTVEANMKVAQTYAPGQRARRPDLRKAALKSVGLAEMPGRRVYSLSGGEQQRVAVARLLLKPCDLVLADEPTGSLDPVNRDAILQALHQMRDNGKTIILVTHDPAVAASCDRVVELRPHTLPVTGRQKEPKAA